jgi:hypothetical protein
MSAAPNSDFRRWLVITGRSWLAFASNVTRLPMGNV